MMSYIGENPAALGTPLWWKTRKKGKGNSNQAPFALDDAISISADQTAIITVLDNDSDPDGDPISLVGAVADTGSVVILPDQTLSYQPAVAFSGTDLITYQITDPGGLTAEATVVVTVAPAPVTLSLTTEPDNTFIVEAASEEISITVTEPAMFAGLYTVDLALLVGGPLNLAPPTIAGGADVGSVLTASPGLWIYEADQTEPVSSVQWYRDGLPITGATSSAYTVLASDAAAAITVEETLTATSNARAVQSLALVVSASSSFADSFTDADGTLLVDHVADNGDTWVAVGNADVSPEIQSNALVARDPAGSQFALSSVSLADVEVRAQIAAPAGSGAFGLMTRVTGSDQSLSGYYARMNWNNNQVELFRFLNGSIAQVTDLPVADPGPGVAVELVLRCIGTRIEVDWDGTTIISATNGDVTSAGSVGIGHYNSGGVWDNFSYGEAS